MDALICADGNRLLSDLERRAPSKEAIIDLVFFTAISECTLVTGLLWDGISDSRIGSDPADVGSDPDLHYPIPKSVQTRLRFDDPLFALGIICYRFELLDKVAELKMQ